MSMAPPSTKSTSSHKDRTFKYSNPPGPGEGYLSRYVPPSFPAQLVDHSLNLSSTRGLRPIIASATKHIPLSQAWRGRTKYEHQSIVEKVCEVLERSRVDATVLALFEVTVESDKPQPPRPPEIRPRALPGDIGPPPCRPEDIQPFHPLDNGRSPQPLENRSSSRPPYDEPLPSSSHPQYNELSHNPSRTRVTANTEPVRQWSQPPEIRLCTPPEDPPPPARGSGDARSPRSLESRPSFHPIQNEPSRHPLRMNATFDTPLRGPGVKFCSPREDPPQPTRIRKGSSGRPSGTGPCHPTPQSTGVHPAHRRAAGHPVRGHPTPRPLLWRMWSMRVRGGSPPPAGRGEPLRGTPSLRSAALAGPTGH
jgi:hypothetical protein